MRLLLLLLPLGLFADVINLKCDYTSQFITETSTVIPRDGNFIVSINNIDKTAILEGLRLGKYEENGSKINFMKAGYTPQSVQFLYEYEIDRVTGKAEEWLYTWGIDVDNVTLEERYNKKNYELDLVSSAMCSPEKPLF